MLTIFAIPKPFRGHIATIQRNAIASWTRLHPECQVILFGNEEGVAETAQEFGVEFVPDLARNEFGTPLLNDVVAQAEQLAVHDIVCFLNCDIILTRDLVTAINAMWQESFLLVGECQNLDVIESLDFAEPNWEATLRARAAQNGVPRGPWGLDYFVFPRGFFGKLPAFAIGRSFFDNWLLWRGRNLNAVVADVTQVVTAIHQNHDYAHVQGGLNQAYFGAEAQRNFELAKGKRYSITDASHKLTANGLQINWPGHWPLRPFRHFNWKLRYLLLGFWSFADRRTRAELKPNRKLRANA